MRSRPLRTLAGALLAIVGASAAALPASSAVAGEEVAVPYLDATGMRPARELSFYAQPWRSYLETVPALQFLDGLGVNYNLPAGAAHREALSALAEAGFRSIRLEVGWGQLGMDDQVQALDRRRLDEIFTAARDFGIRPLILLNANHASPVPYSETRTTATAAAPAGSRTIELQSVAGLVPGRSGLTFSAQKMNEVLFTDIDPGGRVTLSRPLPVAVGSGAELKVRTFKYAPLHPVGTPQFDETAAGWQRYADAVLDVVEANGIHEYDVEIWNELTFGSDFLSIDNYYSPPLTAGSTDPLGAGGSPWELAARTASTLDRDHPGAKVIWGFSNTNFFKTPVTALPPGIDGQSYHPYKTTPFPVPGSLSAAERRAVRDGYLPTTELLVPEGIAPLGITSQRLPRLLSPEVRLRDKPPGSSTFEHFVTEHGFAPGPAGITDPARADLLESQALLRMSTFWLNKGISRMNVSSAWRSKPQDNGLLPASPPPSAWTGLPASALMTPALRSLSNLTSALEGAVPIATPRQLSLSVTPLGPQPEILPGTTTHEPLRAADMLAVLPYQVDASRFVIPTYVMSLDLRRPVPVTEFRLTIGGIDGRSPAVSMFDPLTGTSVPVAVGASGSGQLTVTVQVTDSPRLLIVEE